MRFLLEPDLSSYTDDAFEADLRLLPEQRYEKVMKYRLQADRKRCVRAYMLLWEGLRQEYGLDAAPIFDFGEHGKPFLRMSPELFFSLSHTGNAVLCVLDSQPVGADIEMIRSHHLNSVLRLFSEQEQEEVRQAEQPEFRFMEIWTRKESFLKLTGQGLVGISILSEIPTQDTDVIHFETVIRETDGFVFSVCQWKTPPTGIAGGSSPS